MFGPIRGLPFYILIELGLIDPAISNHMEAMNVTTLYCSTPPSSTSQPIRPLLKPQSSRTKIKSKRKTPVKIVINGAET